MLQHVLVRWRNVLVLGVAGRCTLGLGASKHLLELTL